MQEYSEYNWEISSDHRPTPHSPYAWIEQYDRHFAPVDSNLSLADIFIYSFVALGLTLIIYNLAT